MRPQPETELVIGAFAVAGFPLQFSIVVVFLFEKKSLDIVNI